MEDDPKINLVDEDPKPDGSQRLQAPLFASTELTEPNLIVELAEEVEPACMQPPDDTYAVDQNCACE